MQHSPNHLQKIRCCASPLLYQLLLSQMVNRLVIERINYPIISILILYLINLHNNLDILDNFDRRVVCLLPALCRNHAAGMGI